MGLRQTVERRVDKLVGVFVLSILLGGALGKVVEKALNIYWSTPAELLVAWAGWAVVVGVLWILWPAIEEDDDAA